MKLFFKPFSQMGSIILELKAELQNRFTYYDITKRVTNSNFLKFFQSVTRCGKNLNIILKLLIRDG